MIERLSEGRLILNPPNPMLGVVERAYLECGCSVFVGKRLDNMETATMAASCSKEHDPLINHFQLLMRESLVDPQDKPLVEVCDDLLDQANRYAVIGT
jgi:hypothetical protein